MLATSRCVLKIVSKKCSRISVPLKNVQVMAFSCAHEPAVEKQVLVDGININYVKVGEGEHPVLLLPGSMGSIWTDFKPQIDQLNREEFTIVAWDPPGYGKSRPPDRTFPRDFYLKDAVWACNLMKTLKYDNFSLLGWSDGGISALILAAKFPENTRKLVVTGANAYVTPEEMKIYEKIRDISTWSERMRAPLIALYGEEYFQKTWSNWIDGMKDIFDHNGGDVCKADLPKIQCPTLIVHGEKDAMVLPEHPDYLNKNIKNSRVEIFTVGAHNLHLRYAEEFNAIVEDFLLE
ncbi:hypothetical protein QAD02_004606 [Eretmocerus hayati]|uniref:Uncharacterized protein n=1 Tax=Eretmocerus hayati TaxID=131215 RepID=A0ACC2NQ14_9HYME|nr:hypothetical protein QAD02_004606 [Eretmocerus hayati]